MINEMKNNLRNRMNKLSSSLQNSADAAKKLAESLRTSAMRINHDVDGGRLLSESAGMYEGLASTLRSWSSLLERKYTEEIMMGYLTWLAVRKSCDQLKAEINEREVAVDNAIKKMELNISDDEMRSSDYAISAPVEVSHLAHIGFRPCLPFPYKTLPPRKVPPPRPNFHPNSLSVQKT